MNRYLAMLVLALTGLSAAHAQGDRSFPACPSQQELEQVIGSDGKFTPEACRDLTVTKVKSGKAEICVLDFEPGGDPGFVERLRSAAVPTQWWVSCQNLSVP